MRQLCILGRNRPFSDCLPGSAGEMELDGVPVRYGLIETPDPSFDPDDPANADMVLLRVRAFSCNYRDRALILRMATTTLDRNYYVIGSDFVAEVVASGRNVVDLEPGDRVIANNAFPDSGAANVLPGVASNHSSKEYLVLHRTKLMPIPDTMHDSVAAGFGIGAQTTYGMVRRIAPQPGERVLVTAPRSNTSLFALAALRTRGVQVYGLARSTASRDRLMAAGMSDVLALDPVDPDWWKDEVLNRTLQAFSDGSPLGGGFDAMIDPMADIYLDKVPRLLGVGGRYITCGIADQSSPLTGQALSKPAFNRSAFIAGLMVRNITVHGNCIGSTSDLATALDDYRRGTLDVLVDSVFAENAVGDFLERTYLASDRFGKVVFHY